MRNTVAAVAASFRAILCIYIRRKKNYDQPYAKSIEKYAVCVRLNCKLPRIKELFALPVQIYEFGISLKYRKPGKNLNGPQLFYSQLSRITASHMFVRSLTIIA